VFLSKELIDRESLSPYKKEREKTGGSRNTLYVLGYDLENNDATTLS